MSYMKVNRMTSTHIITPGTTQLVISMPHVGTHIPTELQNHYVSRALGVEDTDWHLPLLYNFAKAIGATILQATVSRYVIDLNRPADNAPMYPGASNTELCPTRFFTGDPIYREGQAPNNVEQARRLKQYWLPYHDCLQTTLESTREKFGYALLWDAHSIRQEIPWLFEGRLPGLNLGTADQRSCAHSLREDLAKVLEQSKAMAPEFTSVVDGRFKGGYTTRHYGKPKEHIHVVQMEMAQALYMSEIAPFAYDEVRAKKIVPVLRNLLSTLLNWQPTRVV
jgi:N-formylglutamate deformylase